MVSTQSEAQYKIIGRRPVRPDGNDKVTGRAQYGADVALPGMLYGRVKRSPHAHAIIKNIDYSKALELEGVKAVVTNSDFATIGDDVADLGETVTTMNDVLDNVLASGKALYAGHAVAAVCATDPHIAEDALELIEVEYEPLSPVLNVHDAMADAAPQLHEEMRTVEMLARFVPGPDQGENPSNTASHLRMEIGDIEKGFSEADIVIEREFETGTAHQGYIEAQNGTALWDQDGQLTVWVSTQGAFAVRTQLAELLKLPLSNVKVVPTEIGGGFGGKIPIYMEPMAALLSKKTGQAVKMTMNREEVLIGTGPTGATYTRVKIGATNDGTLVAAEAYLAFEAGAYPGSPVGAGASCMFASFDIPNVRADAYDVVTNKPKTSAYRAPGSPAATFAVECVMDELAESLEMDPMELRQKNSSHEGTRRADGVEFAVIGAEEVMQATIDSPHYRSELSGENHGRGVSMGFWFNAGMESSASASINADGTIHLILGSVDIGGQRAALAMQFAESMGIEYEAVKPQVVDTDSVGFNGVTGGSRTTYATGWAVHNLALDLRNQLTKRAADIWEVDHDQVSYDDGEIRGPDDKSSSLAELCAKLPTTGGMIQGSADVSPSTPGPAFGCHIVDVEVDRETGKVEVLRYTAVQDVGTAVHPSYVEGQIQGGAAQGVGMALNEEYVYSDEGRMLNSSLLDYRMPTALDLPNIETVLVEVPNPGHPYGVRGVGEVPIVPPLAAVANAIYDAVGIRVRTLPASPTMLLGELLEEQD